MKHEKLLKVSLGFIVLFTLSFFMVIGQIDSYNVDAWGFSSGGGGGLTNPVSYISWGEHNNVDINITANQEGWYFNHGEPVTLSGMGISFGNLTTTEPLPSNLTPLIYGYIYDRSTHRTYVNNTINLRPVFTTQSYYKPSNNYFYILYWNLTHWVSYERRINTQTNLVLIQSCNQDVDLPQYCNNWTYGYAFNGSGSAISTSIYNKFVRVAGTSINGGYGYWNSTSPLGTKIADGYSKRTLGYSWSEDYGGIFAGFNDTHWRICSITTLDFIQPQDQVCDGTIYYSAPLTEGDICDVTGWTVHGSLNSSSYPYCDNASITLGNTTPVIFSGAVIAKSFSVASFGLPLKFVENFTMTYSDLNYSRLYDAQGTINKAYVMEWCSPALLAEDNDPTTLEIFLFQQCMDLLERNTFKSVYAENYYTMSKVPISSKNYVESFDIDTLKNKQTHYSVENYKGTKVLNMETRIVELEGAIAQLSTELCSVSKKYTWCKK